MNKQIIWTVGSVIATGGIIALIVVGLQYGPISGAGNTDQHQNGSANQATSTLDGFAQCLATQKITMYGAVWCPHCQKEKARFGTAFKYVPYVECPDNIKLCLDKGIKGYPTWITQDGKSYEGEQGLEGLSKITNCPLPKNI